MTHPAPTLREQHLAVRTALACILGLALERVDEPARAEDGGAWHYTAQNGGGVTKHLIVEDRCFDHGGGPATLELLLREGPGTLGQEGPQRRAIRFDVETGGLVWAPA
jgi:hypothetical protein